MSARLALAIARSAMRHPLLLSLALGAQLASATAAAAQPPLGPTSRDARPSSADVHWDVADLPLVEVAVAWSAATLPAAERTAAHRTLAIFITGDGDWADLDKGIAAALADGDVPTVGLKARAYLQKGQRTPDGAARDVERIARHYMALWGRDRLVLLGYSRGADMLPFIATRLAPDLRARTTLLGMYGLANAASFEFHWTDLLADTKRASDLPVAPELAKLRGMRMFCVYGDDEKDSACRTADPALVQRVARTGAHHFDKDYVGLGKLVLDALQ